MLAQTQMDTAKPLVPEV